jgi:hypothetical protein
MFKHRVLRKIFRHKREEVPPGWRKLQNEDLHGLYCSLNSMMVITPRRKRWAGNAVHMTKRNAYKVFVGKSEGKRPLERPRCRREDIIKMDLKELRWEQTRFM